MREASPVPQPALRVLHSLLGLAVAVVLLGLVLLIWSVDAAQPGAKKFLLPGPGDTLAALSALFDDGPLWRATGATLGAWIVAFAAAAALGLPIGVIAGRSSLLGALFGPTLLLVAAVPAPLLVLVFILWEGVSSNTGAIVAAALIAFAAIVAISAAAQQGGDAGAGWRGALRALEVGAVLALAAVVFAEGFVGRDQLGALAMQAFANLETPKSFALVVYVWILGVLLALPFALARWIVGLAR